MTAARQWQNDLTIHRLRMPAIAATSTRVHLMDAPCYHPIPSTATAGLGALSHPAIILCIHLPLNCRWAAVAD